MADEQKNDVKLVSVEQDGGQVTGTFEVGPSLPLPKQPWVYSGFNQTDATVFQKFEPTSDIRYNSNHRAIYDMQGIPDAFPEQVRLARKYYTEEPITGTVIDVLAQFSISSVEHIVDDEKVKEFFDGIFYETSNLQEIVKCAFLEYYVACNVWPVRSEKGLKVKTRSGMKVPEYRWTLLNPENVDIVGTLLFDQYMVTVRPNKELVDIAKSKDSNIKNLLRSIPPEMLAAIKGGKNIPIDPDKVYHISRNKQPFQRTAVPFIMRNVGPLRVKQKLIQADLSTADGVINQLVVVTVGSDKHPATQKDLEAVAELIRTPSKAYTLMWNHTLKVDIKSPNSDLFDPKKYEQVNKDILAGYGIARSVVADGGTYASQTVSVQSLIQWLKWGREDIRRWLEREYKIIAEENGLKTYPRVRFKEVSLTEDKLIKNVLMGLYDRGTISAETILNETGHDINVEIKRQEKEKKLKQQGLLLPQSPWQQSKEQSSPFGVAPVTSPGRPDDSPEDEERDSRDDQPAPHGASLRVSATLSEEQESLFTLLGDSYKELKDELLRKLPKTDNKEIQKDVIMASLLVFVTNMGRVTNQSILSRFLSKYTEITGNEDFEGDTRAQKTLGDCVAWNERFIDKLAHDLNSALSDTVDSEAINVLSEIFDTREYRVRLFAQEVPQKADIAGEIAGYGSLGYNRGVWNAMFENTCEVCEERHGQVFSRAEIFDMLPAHPNCKCFIDWIQ